MSKRGPFRTYRPKAEARTFRPHGETREEFVHRVHQKVVDAVTIGSMWQVYFANRFAIRMDEPLDEKGVAILRECFYAGVASMFQLMNKAAGPTEEDDDIGAARLQRLYEELETYEKGLK